MLSFFTIPKPFIGHNGIIQRNAIQSWLTLDCASEVFLLGDDEGVKDVSSKFGIKHISKIVKNRYGTPLISSAFDAVQEVAVYDIICYINADVMLLDDFISGINSVNMPLFLLTGRRWNLDVYFSIDFSMQDWQSELLDIVKTKGCLFSNLGLDYFVFPKQMNIKLPEFAVGRPGWDNWLVYEIWKKGYPIIDATNAITAIHQNHDYSHIPLSTGKIYEGPEADSNRKLLQNKFSDKFGSLDATHVITSKNNVKRALTKEHLRHKWFRIPRLYPHLTWLHNTVTKIYRTVNLPYKKLKLLWLGG